MWKTEILLGGYLPLFVRASSGTEHRTFIDCFAGSTKNVERDTGRSITSSPRLALQADPTFTHLLAFELAENATALEVALREEFPGRAVHVVAGDCNSRITDGLRWWFDQRNGQRGPYLGPTLAYLDPNSLELAWSTVETIARFGMTPPAERAWVRQKGPIELLILFPTGPLKRTLPQRGKAAAKQSACDKVTRLFGSNEWQDIYADQRAGVLSGEASWCHYVDLYRRRLLDLGYTHTSAIEVRSTAGVVIYHMVFATANVTGKKIMTAVMNRASQVLPVMLEEEKKRRLAASQDALEFEDWKAELEAISIDPSRYATLMTHAPVPYVRGATNARGEQLGLFE